MILQKEIVANTRYLRISPFKISKILDKIRGKTYISALKILYNIPQKSSFFVLKTLLSAANNAFYNNNILKENLYISVAYANQGSILKRMHARAKGKSAKIEKKICHITIFVREKNLI
jgi:large subunit ribosomal protein L22